MDAERLFREVRADIASCAHLPTSTYRVQLTPSFRFADAEAIVPYLAKLGVSDLYASPCLKATPGSLHGYDVVDHGQLNPELGTDEEHRRLCQALKEHGMGLLLDFVPNHMGIERDNEKWRDVLENGPASVYARFFDIDWDPVKEELKNKVLLPVLGDQYGIVLENGELKLELESGAFQVRYHDRAFPIAPRAYQKVLGLGLDRLEGELGHSHLDFIELQSILTAIEHLPSRTETERDKVLERSREKEVIKRRLKALVEKNPQVATFVAENVERINGRAVQTLGGAEQLLAEAFEQGNRLELKPAGREPLTLPALEPPARSLPIHPTQLYSAINALLLCLVLLAWEPFSRRDGELMALLLTIYPVTRFLIEMVRDDEPTIWITGLTISQNLSLLVLCGAAGLWWYLLRRPPQKTWG